jgi:tetratricopeptide (TPR) repeat protein
MPRNVLYKPFFHLLLILFIGILGYSNSLHAPFQFDDIPNITENSIIKNLRYFADPSKARVVKRTSEYDAKVINFRLLVSRYIGSLTFALNYKIHGLDVTGYHVVNLAIHLVSSLLVYWLVILVFASLASGPGEYRPLYLTHVSPVALLAALLFVAHPLQTQAVTYIIQRWASLATMFYLLAMVMYIKARLEAETGKNNDHAGKAHIKVLIYYLTGLLAAAFAMKSKEIAFTLPVMIVLYEFLFLKGAARKRAMYLAPFLLTMLIIPVTLILMNKAAGDLSGDSAMAATRLQTGMKRLDYLFTQFRVILTYTRLMFFPVGQNLDYDYPIYRSIAEPGVILSLMTLLAVCSAFVWIFWRFRKRQPLVKVIFFGAAWFFITLSIESSIIPIVDVIFEHRVYLPSAGLFLAVSFSLLLLIEKQRSPRVNIAILFLAVMAVLTLTGLTYARNNVWSDRLSLWQDVVSKSPGKARGYNYLGIAHYEKGNLDSAIEAYKKSVSLNPSYANAYSNLGIAHFENGQIDEAINAFRNAIRVNPMHADAHYNLGLAYGEKGMMREAIIEMNKGVMLKK